MTRVLVVNLFLLLLPFIIFGLWRWFIKGVRSRGELMSDAPILMLMISGLVLVAIGLFSLASFETEGIDRRYVPPAVVDGKLVPGHFEDR